MLRMFLLDLISAVESFCTFILPSQSLNHETDSLSFCKHGYAPYKLMGLLSFFIQATMNSCVRHRWSWQGQRFTFISCKRYVIEQHLAGAEEEAKTTQEPFVDYITQLYNSIFIYIPSGFHHSHQYRHRLPSLD